MKRLEAVIFDWAGTTVDHGSLAPVRAVTELFHRNGIPLSDQDARRDMGIFKKDHIRRILAMPHVESQWRERTGAAPGEPDVERLFAEFARHSRRSRGEQLRGVGAVGAGAAPCLDRRPQPR